MIHIGIPTIYDGVQFRSRLEARWAAFFDIVGWKWAYEPFELDGWIPDFVIRDAKIPLFGGKQHFREILVEVKPVTDGYGFEVFCEKVVKSQGSEHLPVLFLGIDPGVGKVYCPLVCPDVAKKECIECDNRHPEDPPHFHPVNYWGDFDQWDDPRHPSYLREWLVSDMWWGCRCDPGPGILEPGEWRQCNDYSESCSAGWRSAWRQSGNRTQWKKPS